MNKKILIFLLPLLFFPLFQKKTGYRLVIDGHRWVKLDIEKQLMLVWGMIIQSQFIKSYLLETGYKEAAKQINYTDVEYDKIWLKINAVYLDERNRDIPVPIIYFICAENVKGIITNQELEKILEYNRKISKD